MLMVKVISDNFHEPGRSRRPDMCTGINNQMVWRLEIWTKALGNHMKARQQLLQPLDGTWMWHHGWLVHQQSMWIFFFQCIKAWKLWFVWKSLLHVIAISSKRDESRLLQRWELTVLFVGGFTCVRQVSKLNILSVFSCPSLCSWTKWISILI